MSVDLNRIDATTVLITVQEGAGSGTERAVTLVDQAGNMVGSFVLNDTESLTVTCDPGSELHLKRAETMYHRQATGEPIKGIKISVEQVPGGEVSIIHPTFGTFTGVSDIVVNNTGTRTWPTHVTLIKARAPAGQTGTFSLTDEGVVLWNRVHDSQGQARLHGDECNDNSRLHIANVGSSGMDGVTTYYLDEDSDNDGLADGDTVVSTSFILSGTSSQDDTAVESLTWLHNGLADGAADAELARVSFVLDATQNRAVATPSPMWMGTALADVQVLDDFGTVVDEVTGNQPGNVATIHSSLLPDNYDFDLGLLNGNTTGYVYTFTWDAGVDLQLAGSIVVSGKTLRITIYPTDTGTGHDLRMDSSGIFAAGSSASPVSLVIEAEEVERITPCNGDLDGDGDVDQADLGVLLSSYLTDADGDLDGDGDTDQADLGLLLSNYSCGT